MGRMGRVGPSRYLHLDEEEGVGHERATQLACIQFFVPSTLAFLGRCGSVHWAKNILIM